jgi:hypothetical protein
MVRYKDQLKAFHKYGPLAVPHPLWQRLESPNPLVPLQNERAIMMFGKPAKPLFGKPAKSWWKG